jgi:hypothetical protein
MRLRFPLIFLASTLAIAACSSSDGGPLFLNSGSDGAAPDAEPQRDGSSTPPDAFTAEDAGAQTDDGGTDDAETRDSGKDAKGTDDSGGADSGTLDAGADSGDAGADSGTLDAGADSGTLDAGADSGTLDAGADAECGAPYKIFTSDAGPFCPFTLNGPASCATGQHCCEYLADAGLSSTCNEANAACIASQGVVDWGCDEANDCPSNEVCCFVGTVVQDRPECPLYRGVNVAGTVCRPGACNAGEKVICGSQADCSQGTCVGMNMRAKDLGFCK